MRADTHDQLRAVSEPQGFPVVKLLIAVAVLVGLLLFWFWSSKDSTETAVVEPPPTPVAERVAVPAADIPRRPEPIAAPEPEQLVAEAEPAPTAPQPPPTAQEANAIMLQQMALAGADARVGSLVGSEHPVEVSAALIDGLSRGVVLRKILPADSPKEPFVVTEQGDVFYMSSDSYARYDAYSESISDLDTDAVINSFHLLRPIYERTYAQLGLDSSDFDNAVIRTLDLILTTPEISEPIPLQRKSVMYTYADPELEELPSVQKQLLRMGPENIRRIKEQAQSIKDGLLSQ
jgi:hypothetical protein